MGDVSNHAERLFADHGAAGLPTPHPSSLVAERLREATRPANTTVCAPLAVPGCRVEIEVDAIRGSG